MSRVSDNFPKTELEFDSMFGEEAQCRSYLYEHKWPSGFKCEICGHTEHWQSKRGHYICQKCQRQHSLTQGTVMANTQKPLKVWFKAIWYYTSRKSGVNAKNLQELLGISYQTAFDWLHKLRKASKREDREKLSGRVEVDEFYYGGHQKGGKPGRGSENKTAIAVAIERSEKGEIGRIRMEVLPDCSTTSLEGFIKENIELNTEVVTDGWTGYNTLNDKGEFNHQIEVVEKDQSPLPGVHRSISLFKRLMLGTYQGRVEHKYLNQYLEEFTFRFNRRKSKFVGKKFMRMVTQVALSAYFTVNQIVEIFTGNV